jgi:opacity protein-like surface antigen
MDMQISKVAGLIALALFMMTTISDAAPDRTGKTDIGFNLSGAIPDDDDVDSTLYAGGSLAHGFSNWLALGVEAGWAEFEESGLGFEVEETAVPIFGDIILRVPLEAPLQPYAIVGLGAIIWNVDDNVANIETDVDTAFAAKFGVGLDWFVNDNWIVNFEASFVTSDADATVRNTVTGASVTGEGETDFWMVGGGIKYLFS